MNITLPAAVLGVLLAAVGAPHAAHAGQSDRVSDPADPAAPVPALVYVSAFQDAPRPPDAGQTPDQLWRAANDALSAAPQHGGHAGHGPTQAAEPSHAHQAPAAAAAAVAPKVQATAQPAAQPAAQPVAPRPAAGHDQHHHH